MGWEQIGTAAATAGMGLMLGKYADERQYNQQSRLQKLQIAGEQQLMDYSYAKQLQMWKDTNYGAQLAQMKAAGLSPGLMYGMKGGGGVTTGNPTANIEGAKAPMGGGEWQSAMAMGMQLELLKAQKENIQADTQLKQTEAGKKGGVDTEQGYATIENLKQDTRNKAAQEDLTRVETRLNRIKAYIQGETVEDAIAIIAQQRGKLDQEVMQAEVKTFIDRATQNTLVDMTKVQLAGMVIENELKKSNIQVNEAQINKWTTEIVQKWREIEQQGYKLQLEHGQLIVSETQARTQQQQAQTQARGVTVEEGRLQLEQKIRNVTDQTKLTTETIVKIIGSILGNKVVTQ